MAKAKEKAQPTTSEAAFESFKKHFAHLALHQNYGEAFEDFLDYALWALCSDKTSADMVATATRLEKKYKPDMGQMFLDWTYASDNNGEGFHDILGDLFMDLVSHGHNGQFFTPDRICALMVELVNIKELKAGQTVCDPCCGSGRMLLAGAKLNRDAIFYGADVSETCCKMTALNMIINTMQGEVAHMNSLSMEHYKSWHIRRVLVGTHYMPFFFTTGKNQSRMFVSSDPAAAPTTPPATAPKPFKKILTGREPIVQSLFEAIPQTDITEYFRQAAQSNSSLEKANLWQKMKNVS